MKGYQGAYQKLTKSFPFVLHFQGMTNNGLNEKYMAMLYYELIQLYGRASLDFNKVLNDSSSSGNTVHCNQNNDLIQEEQEQQNEQEEEQEEEHYTIYLFPQGKFTSVSKLCACEKQLDLLKSLRQMYQKYYYSNNEKRNNNKNKNKKKI
jgi:hypothetical protein